MEKNQYWKKKKKKKKKKTRAGGSSPLSFPCRVHGPYL